MQIIDKTDCYVSKDDLIHLYDKDNMMPVSLQLGLRDALVNDKDYVKIEDEYAQEYIFASDIPSFENLYKLKIDELRQNIINIVLEDIMSDNHGYSLSLQEILTIKRNREYMIRQMKEMIAFKKKKPEVLYPDIPKPHTGLVTNGKVIAQQSYNNDTVVIYNKDGSKVEKVDDIEFCTSAFKVLTRDFNLESELEMNYDGNYFVIKNKEKKLSEEEKRLMRKRIVD